MIERRMENDMMGGLIPGQNSKKTDKYGTCICGESLCHVIGGDGSGTHNYPESQCKYINQSMFGYECGHRRYVCKSSLWHMYRFGFFIF